VAPDSGAKHLLVEASQRPTHATGVNKSTVRVTARRTRCQGFSGMLDASAPLAQAARTGRPLAGLRRA
jgi:hypothetical protein